ncbi:MAG TPA: sugar phosphate nucleotidyltransferase, partial [Pararhizobium sp.]|nr:sugar phosphate nucleotidyltransferase [Pararhizobium sp.]
MNAMVLAAGLGLRMRPITDTLPKPLVCIADKPLIDYALDALADVGATRAIVNVHHLADQVRTHLAGYYRLETIVSDESDRLLDSGGGIVRALPLLGERPFFVLNADTFWIDEPAAGSGNLQ